ncbi:MAG: hypothetical protein KF846_00020 [Cyclobacteriaceae bacterium]|nr:hypothetical protein [Cyclobacteriaceae bacterium]
MKTDQLSCLVPVHFSKRDEDSHSYHKSSFLISPKDGEYDSRNQNIIWEGRYDAYIVTITQEHHHADIKEEHIKVEKNAAITPDPSLVVSFPKKDIAQALNKYLNQAFA